MHLAARAAGLLAEFNRAGVLDAADVHVASTLGRLGGERDDQVLLAAALAVRALRLGSVCVDLRAVARQHPLDVDRDDIEPADVEALPWPDPDRWRSTCAASALVAVGSDKALPQPVRLVDDLLYLDRYWRQEQVVSDELDRRSSSDILLPVDEEALAASLHRHFPGPAPDLQRLAAAACATGLVTIVAGGPGTGKTTTVARVLAVLDDLSDAQQRPSRVALAAPTGKAAARLQDAIAGTGTDDRDGTGREGIGPAPAAPPVPFTASTLHRLLGWRPGAQGRFRYHRGNRLPADVVIVDETSMVSLPLMARLLEALRPDARLVLVGDPDQLASVEAGAVLGDLVGRPAPAEPSPRLAVLQSLCAADLQPAADSPAAEDLRRDVVRLRTIRRFGTVISGLAVAIRAGDPDAALQHLRAGAAEVEFVEVAEGVHPYAGALSGLRADAVAAGTALYDAASAGDVRAALQALDRHRLLCGHRQGPYGVARWVAEVERWIATRVESYAGSEWYVGRPVIVTANDYDVGLYNGDTGVVVEHPGVGRVVAFGRGSAPILLPPARLSAVTTVHAMTVHRGQGSQFSSVSIVLPPSQSPLLTRELLYTAVTRAETHVRLIGSEQAVRRAVTRPIVRASGLRERPAPPPQPPHAD